MRLRITALLTWVGVAFVLVRRAADPARRRPPTLERVAPHKRLYCMVPTRSKRKESWKAILETWGPRCDVLKFFVDDDDGGDDDDHFSHAGYSVPLIRIATAPRACKDPPICSKKKAHNIWEKVWRSWLFVRRNDLESAEFFFKIDDDTYPILSNVRAYLRNKDHREHFYFGHALYHLRQPMIAGAFTGFSRKTVSGMGDIYEDFDDITTTTTTDKCKNRLGAQEESMTSSCLLYELEVEATPTTDFENKERVLLWSAAELLVKPKNDRWYWKGKPESVGAENDCCSAKPFALHMLKKPSSVRALENLIFDPRNRTLVELSYEYARTPEDARLPSLHAKSRRDLLNAYDVTALGRRREVFYFSKLRENVQRAPEWHRREYLQY